MRDRVSGKTTSKVADKSDILSLFLGNPEVFDEDFIIDETSDLFLAGWAT